jgi:hypothetical protein
MNKPSDPNMSRWWQFHALLSHHGGGIGLFWEAPLPGATNKQYMSSSINAKIVCEVHK